MRDTKTEILNAAREMVLSGGSQAVSMRKIGAKLGVTAMAVYRHFPNREALLARLAEDCFTQLAAKWSTVTFGHDVESASSVIVDLFVDVAVESPGLFSFMFIEKRPGARRFPDDFKGDDSPTFAVLGSVIDQAIAQGRMRPIEQWRFALSYTAVIHGLSQMYIGGRINADADEFRQLCHDTTALLIRGLTTD